MSARLLPQLAGTVNRPRRIVRFGLQVLGLSLAIISLAQPRWGYTFEDVKRKGLDLLIAVDTSRSMLSNDVQPDRLTRVKLAIQDLIDQLQGDRVGLIAFAGRAFLQAPLTIDYDAVKKRLRIGSGYVENVEPAVWRYEVSGKQVLLQWFSYRKKNRERPIIGDRRPPSPLGNIQPDHWIAEYTTELLNVLNVLGCLVELESYQAALLDRVCSGAIISSEELRVTGALERSVQSSGRNQKDNATDLFDEKISPEKP